MEKEPNGVPAAELAEMERRADQASPAPWKSFIEGRDHSGGDDFIRIGGLDDAQPDMYISQYVGATSAHVPAADLDFSAHARQDVPRLVAELKRLRRLLSDSGVDWE
jgi:hypothetical protein